MADLIGKTRLGAGVALCLLAYILILPVYLVVCILHGAKKMLRHDPDDGSWAHWYDRNQRGD